MMCCGESDVYMTRHSARADRESRNWRPLSGHSSEDCELSKKGEEASKQLKEKFDSIQLSHIVSSPFLRCIQTVLPIAIAKGLKIKVEPGIGEVNSTGFWDATSLASGHNFPIDTGFNPVITRDRLRPEWEDGDAAKRSKKAASVLRERLDGPILFCGHGASCLGVAAAFGGSGYVGYSSFSHFRLEGDGWNVVGTMGDVSHLSDELAKESLASAW